MITFVLVFIMPLPVLVCVVVTWKLHESKSGTNELSTCEDKLVQTYISSKLQTSPGLYAVLSLRTLPFDGLYERRLTMLCRH